MALGPDHHKQAARHVFGPRPVAALVPALLRPAFRRRSPAASRIMLDWELIVGPAVAAIAAPRRLSAGVLVLGCTGPAALELQHLSDQLACRINTYLGVPAVARLRLVQERRDVAPPRAKPAAADPEAARAATAAVACLPEGALRDSLRRLGERVLCRSF